MPCWAGDHLQSSRCQDVFCSLQFSEAETSVIPRGKEAREQASPRLCVEDGARSCSQANWTTGTGQAAKPLRWGRGGSQERTGHPSVPQPRGLELGYWASVPVRPPAEVQH